MKVIFTINAERPTDKSYTSKGNGLTWELEFLPHHTDDNIFGTQRIYRAPLEFFFLFFIEFVTSHHLEESMTEWNELMRMTHGGSE